VNLEPEVIASITRHKRKVFLLKSLIVAVLAFSLVSSIALCLWAYRTGTSSTDEFVRSRFGPAELRASLIIFVLGFGTPTVFVVLQVLKKARSRVPLIVKSNLNIGDKEWLRKFRNGLEGASIALGVRPPELMVLDIKGVAAFAFMKARDKPVVAVTREVLWVPISVEEADALMAERLSHMVTGDLLTWRGYQDNLWLLAFPAIAVAFFGMFLTIEAGMGMLSFLLMFINYLCFVVIVFFLVRKSRQIRFHNELLTDSIASKITGNPAALKNALIKLDSANLLGGRVYSGPESARKEERGKIRKPGGELVVHYEEGHSIDERVRNLEAIELGNWQALE